jgi:[amino group carrier protein]-L-2-aminoadipate 6-kinase
MLVVKMGGAQGIDVDKVLDDLSQIADPWILVHGGNQELNAVSEKLGHKPRFVTSPGGYTSRVTDEATIHLIEMVYRGKLNSEIVRALQKRGVNAVGLSGLDGRLWQAERKEAIRVIENGRKFLLRDDFTGKVHTVNTKLLELLIENQYRPVLTLPALGPDGEALNVDGDRAAAAVASSMQADEFVILSNVPGLLRNVEDPDSLIPNISRAQLKDANSEFAVDRMKKKLLAVEEALDGGVSRVVLGTANVDHPVRNALAGNGTVIQ